MAKYNESLLFTHAHCNSVEGIGDFTPLNHSGIQSPSIMWYKSLLPTFHWPEIKDTAPPNCNPAVCPGGKEIFYECIEICVTSKNWNDMKKCLKSSRLFLKIESHHQNQKNGYVVRYWL